jgi:N-acetylmuramoyl-L-alanine amidase
MSMFIGVDLGWYGKPSGLASIALEGSALHLRNIARLESVDEILDWIQTEAGDGSAVAAVDAPLIIRNRTSIRPAERELNADFRKLRLDPHVLLPGDRLYIPDKEEKVISAQTTLVHTFRLRRKETRLRIVVRDVDGTPLGGKKYQLMVQGEFHEGVLPEGGLLDEPIPADALEGELKVWAEVDFPEHADTWNLKLGHLDPVEDLKGVQARLNNLGYDCGPVDGISGPRTQAAVKAFQKEHGLDVDGIPGPRTQAALKSEHTC